MLPKLTLKYCVIVQVITLDKSRIEYLSWLRQKRGHSMEGGTQRPPLFDFLAQFQRL